MEENKVYNDELEQMRHDMDELRSLLSEQQIVNEQLMRRAMQRDLGKERRTTVKVSLLCVLAAPVYVFLMPEWGVPLWFGLLTVAFLVLACVASVWSVRRLMDENLLTGDLLVVAKHIADYKRFGNNWLKFSIPFLCVWLTLFFYYISQQMESDAGVGMLCGGIVGLLIGTGCGIFYVVQSRRRLNGVLRQIKELRGEE